MTPLDFLAAVLPSPGHGFYCTAELSTTKKEHRYEEKLEDLIPFIDGWKAQGRDIYFALSTFAEANSREAVNARFIKAMFIDMDGYASKKDAAAAGAFMAKLPATAEADRSRESYATTVAEKDPKGALAWANTITDKERQQRAVENVVRTWVKQDAPAAKEWIAQSALTDEVKARIQSPSRGGFTGRGRGPGN